MALKNGGQFHEELIGIFMFMIFMIVGLVEFSLCRQLSRLNRASDKKTFLNRRCKRECRLRFAGPQPRTLGEPVQSVTENTTRTLEYSRNEPFEH